MMMIMEGGINRAGVLHMEKQEKAELAEGLGAAVDPSVSAAQIQERAGPAVLKGLP